MNFDYSTRKDEILQRINYFRIIKPEVLTHEYMHYRKHMKDDKSWNAMSAREQFNAMCCIMFVHCGNLFEHRPQIYLPGIKTNTTVDLEVPKIKIDAKECIMEVTATDELIEKAFDELVEMQTKYDTTITQARHYWFSETAIEYIDGVITHSIIVDPYVLLCILFDTNGDNERKNTLVSDLTRGEYIAAYPRIDVIAMPPRAILWYNANGIPLQPQIAYDMKHIILRNVDDFTKDYVTARYYAMAESHDELSIEKWRWVIEYMALFYMTGKHIDLSICNQRFDLRVSPEGIEEASKILSDANLFVDKNIINPNIKFYFSPTGSDRSFEEVEGDILDYYHFDSIYPINDPNRDEMYQKLKNGDWHAYKNAGKPFEIPIHYMKQISK